MWAAAVAALAVVAAHTGVGGAEFGSFVSDVAGTIVAGSDFVTAAGAAGAGAVVADIDSVGLLRVLWLRAGHIWAAVAAVESTCQLSLLGGLEALGLAGL